MPKLLLKEDVYALGKKGDIVRAKPGYARNYLLPKGFALVADANAVRMQDRLREERKQQAIVDKHDAEELAKKLETVLLETTVKVDKEGRMYGSVAVVDLMQLLETTTGIKLEKHNFLLKQPIKKLGEHTVELKLKEGVQAVIRVAVASETVLTIAEDASSTTGV